MKQLMVAMAILGFMAGCATQPHNTVSEKPQVSAVINGKQMELVPEVRARLVEKSVALLSSCVFSDLHPQENLAGALKQSHLRFTFSPPRKVEVPVEKITVGVSEMVITLPLSSGGIWVRADKGLMYFAKFKHSIVEELQKLLKEAAAVH